MTTAEEHFTLKFDGEALNEHTMSVEQLAPSLLALGRVFQDAQRVASPGQPAASLNIKVTREGSFAVDLMVQMPSMLESAVSLMLSRDMQAGLSAYALVAITKDAIQMVKWVYGKLKLRTESLGDGQVRITDEHGNSIVVQSAALAIVQDGPFRQDLEAFTAPLDIEGIDSISLEDSGEATVIRAEDRTAYVVPDEEETEVAPPAERDVVLRIDNLAFQNGNKWKVNDGERAFYATITDLEFLARTENGEERFTATDRLKVLLRSTQFKTSKNVLKFEHEILKVYEHQPGARQIPLPFEDEN